MDANGSLRDGARIVVREALLLARQEIKAAVRSVAPEYRIVRRVLLTGAVAAAMGLAALLIGLLALMLMLGQVVPLWASALVVSLGAAGASAALVTRARRLFKRMTDGPPVAMGPPRPVVLAKPVRSADTSPY